MRIRITGVLLLISMSLLAACSRSLSPMVPVDGLAPDEETSAALPNPASVHCEEQGGTVDIRTDETGAQVGFCVFADGSECEEWAFSRGECAPGAAGETGMPNPASVFCEEQGGTVDIRTDESGGQVGFCVFADGGECDEWAYFRGECAPAEVSPGTDAETEESAGATTIYLPGIAALQAFDYADWQSYKNMTYGFSFRFPLDWLLEEVTNPDDTMYRHRVTLTHPQEPMATLHIAFKAASEDQQITPTGLGAGDIVDRGSVPFLGEDLVRQALVAEGKDFGVLYGGTGEVVRGELVFWMGLNYAGNPMEDPGLSAEVQTLADQIVASLQTER
jgi:putative hemolysin